MDDFLQMMADTAQEELVGKKKPKRIKKFASDVAYGVGYNLANEVVKNRRLPFLPENDDSNSPEPEY